MAHQCERRLLRPGDLVQHDPMFSDDPEIGIVLTAKGGIDTDDISTVGVLWSARSTVRLHYDYEVTLWHRK